MISTIPVGIAGLALDHLLRSTLGKPIPAAAFLTANGVVLLAAERLRRGGSGAITGRRERVPAEQGRGSRTRDVLQRRRHEP